MKRVVVNAPSHVHVGNFDLNGELGRLFGTVGITLQEPSLEVEVEMLSSAESDIVEGPYSDVVREHLGLLRRELRLRHAFKVHVKSAFPRGVGLGLTTALVLSLGVAVTRLCNIDISVLDIAKLLRRGLVSALGTYSFAYGGFIVDGGLKIGELGRRIPPLIVRVELPEDWHIVVALLNYVPERIREIKSREAEILATLPRMSSELSGRLCRLVLCKMLPAAIERDIKAFGEALAEFNYLAGTYWSPFQDGRPYCCPEVERGIKIMLEEGAYGAAQSCWGPTFYCVVDSLRRAEKIRERLIAELPVTVWITRCRNYGAKITLKDV